MAETLFLIVAIACCLGAEAFFSGTETGMISLNRIRLRRKAEDGDDRAMFLQNVLENPERLLASTLVGTNLAVVTGSALATKLFTILVPGHVSLATSFIMIPTIVVFGELIPKAVFRRRPAEILLPAVPLLKMMLWGLSLPARFIGFASKTLLQWADDGEGRSDKSPFVTKEELRYLIKTGVSEGTLEPSQQRMLHGAFAFSATAVRETMIPLTEVEAVPCEAIVSDVLNVARRTRLSRFPVYSERIDQVTGLVNLADLLYGNVEGDEPIRQYIREPLYLPNTVPIDSALFRMQRNHEQMAVVVDEYGGCDGIITVQDIIEEVMGDLDSTRRLPEEITILSPSSFQVDSHIDIDQLNDELGLNLPKKNYETLAGFLMTRFERIPAVGEQLRYGNLTFEVLSLKGPTIQKVHLKIDN